MSEKIINELMDLGKALFPYFTTFILSIWGGTVSHIERLKKDKRNFAINSEYWMDMIICTFAGLVTYFICMWSNIDGWLQAVLISISSHMGTRALASFETIHRRLFNWKQ